MSSKMAGYDPERPTDDPNGTVGANTPEPVEIMLMSEKPKITTDRETMDRTIGPDGQQAQYLVLSEEERAQGFVRPVRRTYRHLKCGTTTTMGFVLAETYARNPSFYTGTFCLECRTHPPVGEGGEFVWVGGFVVRTNAQRFVQNPGEEKVGT